MAVTRTNLFNNFDVFFIFGKYVVVSKEGEIVNYFDARLKGTPSVKSNKFRLDIENLFKGFVLMAPCDAFSSLQPAKTCEEKIEESVCSCLLVAG